MSGRVSIASLQEQLKQRTYTLQVAVSQRDQVLEECESLRTANRAMRRMLSHRTAEVERLRAIVRTDREAVSNLPMEQWPLKSNLKFEPRGFVGCGDDKCGARGACEAGTIRCLSEGPLGVWDEVNKRFLHGSVGGGGYWQAPNSRK